MSVNKHMSGMIANHSGLRETQDYLADTLAENAKLKSDCMTLVLRLMGEQDNTFAPNTREVMDRWRPLAEALLRGES